VTGRPHVVVLSGTLHPGSKVDRIAGWCARRCQGATTSVFTGTELEFPFYRPASGERGAAVVEFLAELAAADGVVLVSPAYHGAPSGLLKNALDYLNDLAGGPRPFLDGRAIGCVAVAGGEQGAASTLAALRSIGHALRGWPTPLGITLAGELAAVHPSGEPLHRQPAQQLQIMLDQVVTLARIGAGGPHSLPVEAAPV
jgi:NAD(P)H-dependent FMN reductase